MEKLSVHFFRFYKMTHRMSVVWFRSERVRCVLFFRNNLKNINTNNNLLKLNKTTDNSIVLFFFYQLR